jgi:hypothetical protein
MMILSPEQFDNTRRFIYRQGNLLTRRQYAYHFEHGDKQAVLDALACYQNDDGGFGNGLELDIMCPASSGICMEVALGHLVDLGVHEGALLDRAIEWILSTGLANGDLPHPVCAVKAYPHGPWWEKDEGRILAVSGLLGRMGRSHPDIAARAAAFFEQTHVPFPEDIGVYSYPIALYLRYAEGADKHSQYRRRLEAAFPALLEKAAWHHPLFFCHNRWDSSDIPTSLWRSEAERAVATIQADGGVHIEQYANLPWWQGLRI